MTKFSIQSQYRRRLFVGIIAIVLAFLTLGSWAFSSAVGSSPDDNFHLASIWCGEGDRNGICESQPGTSAKLVPKLVYESANCYAYQAEQSAKCQNLDLAGTHNQMSLAEHANSINLYPPVFYGVDSFFVSSDIAHSVLSIRLFNALLAVSLFACLFLLLPNNLKHIPLWAIAATSVPLGMFIIPSTNPSSWAIVSAGVLLFSLLGFFQTSGARKTLLAGLSLVAVFVGAGARGDSGLYSIIIAGLAVFLTFQRTRNYLAALWLPLAVCLIGAYFYLSTNQASLAAAGLEGAADPTLTTVQLIIVNTIRMPLLWLGVFGSWGLGWLDTILPQTVWISSLIGFVLLVILGVNRLRQRTVIAAIAVGLALWLIPLYVLVKSHAVVGTLVQPRYLLPLIIVLAGILAYRGLRDFNFRYSFIPWLAIASLSLANSLALHRNIKRYTAGVDAAGWNLDNSVEWWWNIPISPMGMWTIGTISFALFLVALMTLTPKFAFGFGGREEPYVSPRIFSRKLT